MVAPHIKRRRAAAKEAAEAVETDDSKAPSKPVKHKAKAVSSAVKAAKKSFWKKATGSKKT
tara:strand:+ start:613 stop:795 length:183 start_codon:yes stop_codon:yes gene_type:complete